MEDNKEKNWIDLFNHIRKYYYAVDNNIKEALHHHLKIIKDTSIDDWSYLVDNLRALVNEKKKDSISREAIVDASYEDFNEVLSKFIMPELSFKEFLGLKNTLLSKIYHSKMEKNCIDLINHIREYDRAKDNSIKGDLYHHWKVVEDTSLYDWSYLIDKISVFLSEKKNDPFSEVSIGEASFEDFNEVLSKFTKQQLSFKEFLGLKNTLLSKIYYSEIEAIASKCINKNLDEKSCKFEDHVITSVESAIKLLENPCASKSSELNKAMVEALKSWASSSKDSLIYPEVERYLFCNSKDRFNNCLKNNEHEVCEQKNNECLADSISSMFAQKECYEYYTYG